MPLSKARDRKRKQLAKLNSIVRLESKQFQPKPGLHNSYSANQQPQGVPIPDFRRPSVTHLVNLDGSGEVVPDYY